MLTTATTTTHRQRYLRDALDQLFAGMQRPTQNGRQASIKLGARSVSLEAWEWDTLVDWSSAATSEPSLRWRTLVVEALALQSRTYADLDRLRAAADGPTADIESSRSDLHLDAVLAYRILAELQRETERMVGGGGMDQAKRLTQFRKRLNDCLTAVGKAVGETALKEAEEIAAQKTADPTPERIRSVDDNGEKLQALFALEEQLRRRELMRETARPPEAAPAPPVEAPIDAMSPAKQAHLRRALVAILLLVVAGWVARTLLSRTTPAVQKELDAASFASVTGIRSVVSRAPSLFVVMDESAWTSLPAGERLRVVEQVASAAGAAGYSGAVVRTTGGQIVGQWLKSGGARLVTGGS